MLGEELFKGVCEIAQEVPAIGHLDSLGCATRGTFGVATSSIAAHNFYLIFACVNHSANASALWSGKRSTTCVPLEIDQDGAVRSAFAARPLVDAEYARRGPRGKFGAADQADEGRGTGRHAYAVKEPAAGRTAEGKGDGSEEVGLPSRPSRVGQHDGWKTLGEDALRTAGRSAGKLAHPQLQVHGQTAPRQVGQGASIASADARRALITAWTVGGWQRMLSVTRIDVDESSTCSS